MKRKHVFFIFLLGTLLGSAPFLIKQLLAPEVVATGILKSHSVDGSLTADFPGGYYVESRVYVENIDTSLLGKRVTVEGDIESIVDTDHIWHYPLIINENEQTKFKVIK